MVFYTKLSLDKEHMLKASIPEIQAKIDEYARNGWRLISTDATDFGAGVYFYLHFEKEAF